jgi:hypothetical protein
VLTAVGDWPISIGRNGILANILDRDLSSSSWRYLSKSLTHVIQEIKMSATFGPYVQMRKLAQQMAIQYQKDTNLPLEPLLAHFMEEVEVNVASDQYDHSGFMEKIREPLNLDAEMTLDHRRKEFLHAVVGALQERIQQEA